MIVTITIDINATDFSKIIQGETRQIEAGINKVVNDTLVLIEQSQILAYTASSKPPLPSGSTYVRKFNLRASSRRIRTGNKLPLISGIWFTDANMADYAQYVIGDRNQQAKIHRGRWKSREDVVNEVMEKLPGLIKKHFG